MFEVFGKAWRDELNLTSELNILLIKIIAEETLKPVDVRLGSNRHRICSTWVLPSTSAFQGETRELARFLDVSDN